MSDVAAALLFLSRGRCWISIPRCKRRRRAKRVAHGGAMGTLVFKNRAPEARHRHFTQCVLGIAVAEPFQRISATGNILTLDAALRPSVVIESFGKLPGPFPASRRCSCAVPVNGSAIIVSPASHVSRCDHNGVVKTPPGAPTVLAITASLISE